MKTVPITGIEANLLLFLLDGYMACLRDGDKHIPGYRDMDALRELRDRLFAAHEHPEDGDAA